MKKFLFILSLLSISFMIHAQEVYNIQASVDGTDIVITYAINGSAYVSGVAVELWGQKPRVISEEFLSGDVFKSVKKGTYRKIVYNVTDDVKGNFIENDVRFIIKLGRRKTKNFTMIDYKNLMFPQHMERLNVGTFAEK